MHHNITSGRGAGTTAGLAVVAILLLSSGCGAETGGADDERSPLPGDTHRRVLSQGVDPALVYGIELSGFELAEQSAGVLGDSDYGATYVPAHPPFTAELYLEVRSGPYDEAGCGRDPLRGPTGGLPAAVESCEAEADGWYRTGGDWHEYVAMRAGHHLTLGAPSDVVDRKTLTRAALEARPQETTTSPMPPSSPVTRGDLPTTGDGAPVDPDGVGRPGE